VSTENVLQYIIKDIVRPIRKYQWNDIRFFHSESKKQSTDSFV